MRNVYQAHPAVAPVAKPRSHLVGLRVRTKLYNCRVKQKKPNAVFP